MEDPEHIPQWPELTWRTTETTHQRVVLQAFTRWYDGSVQKSRWVVSRKIYEDMADNFADLSKRVENQFAKYFQSKFHREGFC